MPSPENPTPPPTEQPPKAETESKNQTPAEFVETLCRGLEALLKVQQEPEKETTIKKMEGLKTIITFFTDVGLVEPLPEHYTKPRCAKSVLEKAIEKLVDTTDKNPMNRINELNLLLLASALRAEIKASK